MWLILLGIGIFIVLLIYLEYVNHDCINGKACYHSTPTPGSNDEPPVIIDKLYNMVRSTTGLVRWRQALLVGLILAVPLGYLLTRSVPGLFKLIFVVLIIFIAVYYSYSWLHAHFYAPTIRQIEKNLILLKDKIMKAKSKKTFPEKKSSRKESGKKKDLVVTSNTPPEIPLETTI